MLFCDLLRMTVLLIAAVATVLATISVVLLNQDFDPTALIVAGAWWAIAAIVGLVLGSQRRAGEAMSGALRNARTSTTLPSESPARIALSRLWPIGAFALVTGGLAWVIPPVAVVGTGYCIAVALAWRRREAAVSAVEDRDGVRFYVEPSSALQPIKLVRTPGLGCDRTHSPHHPPPPPPARSESARRDL